MADILCGWIHCAEHAFGDDYCPMSEWRYQTRKGYLGYYVVDTANSNLSQSKPFITHGEAVDYADYLNCVNSSDYVGEGD